MDKYEYRVKMQEIKRLIEDKDYESAAKIADGINWKKVKNANTLTHIGKMYAQLGRYEDSIDLLLMAYDHSSIGRNVVYELTCVAIQANDVEAARDYYNEFLEIAPQDPMKFILRYKLAKALGAPVQELITILEEYKEMDYSEEWSYELAYLYHKASMAEKCVEECDELELWFGDGIYVEKALELKMLYQPLTRHQEDKYRRLKQNRSGVVEVKPSDELESGEIVNNPVQIPTVKTNPSKFNTVNLQAELAKSMQEIMEATKQDEVADTLNNVKKMAAEIPYLQLDPQEEKVQRLTELEDAAQIDGELKNDFQELLAEDYDGQISMRMPEYGAPLERQITGQISIDDILAEWERTKRAAEVAMENAKMRKLESARQRALQETGNLMERLQDVMPQLEREAKPQQDEVQEPEQDTDSTKEDSANYFAVSEEPKVPQEPLPTSLEEEPSQERDDEIEFDLEDFEMGSGYTQQPNYEIDTLPADTLSDEIEIEEERDMEEELDQADKEADEIEDVLREELSGILNQEIDQLTKTGQGIEEILKRPENKLPDATQKLPSLDQLVLEEVDKANEEADEEEDILPQIADPEEDEEEFDLTELTKEQKELFSYFVPVSSMEKQICQALVGATKRLKQADGTSRSGNIIIQGYPGSGKTQLASNLLKALQEMTGQMEGRPGRIYADSLNQKDVAMVLEKVRGGCLIIEKAGELSSETVRILSDLMEQDTGGLLLILEDTRVGIEEAMKLSPSFAKKFTEKISIPIFTSDELVTFAKRYAKDEGYILDEMAILALYNRISNVQRIDQATTLTEVKDILDEAIENSQKSGFRKAFGNVFSKNKSQDGLKTLMEKDFEV